MSKNPVAGYLVSTPLVIALLIIVAIMAQVAAFIITLRIRRKLNASDEEENNVPNITDRENRIDKSGE